MTTADLTRRVSRFTRLDLARSYANRCKKLHLVLLGDDDRYWVDVPRVTDALHLAGYEYAE